VCQATIFTACLSRHQLVWPRFTQATKDVIRGFETAWEFFGGVFPVAIPDNMRSIVVEAEHTAPGFNDTFVEGAQIRGFVTLAAQAGIHCQTRAGTRTPGTTQC
jgi:transposase